MNRFDFLKLEINFCENDDEKQMGFAISSGQNLITTLCFCLQCLTQKDNELYSSSSLLHCIKRVHAGLVRATPRRAEFPRSFGFRPLQRRRKKRYESTEPVLLITMSLRNRRRWTIPTLFALFPNGKQICRRGGPDFSEGGAISYLMDSHASLQFLQG